MVSIIFLVVSITLTSSELTSHNTHRLDKRGARRRTVSGNAGAWWREWWKNYVPDSTDPSVQPWLCCVSTVSYPPPIRPPEYKEYPQPPNPVKTYDIQPQSRIFRPPQNLALHRSPLETTGPSVRGIYSSRSLQTNLKEHFKRTVKTGIQSQETLLSKNSPSHRLEGRTSPEPYIGGVSFRQPTRDELEHFPKEHISLTPFTRQPHPEQRPQFPNQRPDISQIPFRRSAHTEHQPQALDQKQRSFQVASRESPLPEIRPHISEVSFRQPARQEQPEFIKQHISLTPFTRQPHLEERPQFSNQRQHISQVSFSRSPQLDIQINQRKHLIQQPQFSILISPQLGNNQHEVIQQQSWFGQNRPQKSFNNNRFSEEKIYPQELALEPPNSEKSIFTQKKVFTSFNRRPQLPPRPQIFPTERPPYPGKPQHEIPPHRDQNQQTQRPPTFHVESPPYPGKSQHEILPPRDPNQAIQRPQVFPVERPPYPGKPQHKIPPHRDQYPQRQRPPFHVERPPYPGKSQHEILPPRDPNQAIQRPQIFPVERPPYPEKPQHEIPPHRDQYPQRQRPPTFHVERPPYPGKPQHEILPPRDPNQAIQRPQIFPVERPPYPGKPQHEIPSHRDQYPQRQRPPTFHVERPPYPGKSQHEILPPRDPNHAIQRPQVFPVGRPPYPGKPQHEIPPHRDQYPQRQRPPTFHVERPPYPGKSQHEILPPRDPNQAIQRPQIFPVGRPPYPGKPQHEIPPHRDQYPQRQRPPYPGKSQHEILPPRDPNQAIQRPQVFPVERPPYPGKPQHEIPPYRDQNQQRPPTFHVERPPYPGKSQQEIPPQRVPDQPKQRTIYPGKHPQPPQKSFYSDKSIVTKTSPTYRTIYPPTPIVTYPPPVKPPIHVINVTEDHYTPKPTESTVKEDDCQTVGPPQVVPRPDRPLPDGMMPPCAVTGKNFCLLTNDYPTDFVDRAIDKSLEKVRLMYEELQTVGDPKLFLDHSGNSSAARGNFVCETAVEVTKPGWVRDEISKEWMVVINTDLFPQKIRTERCKYPNEPCAYIAQHFESTCQQRFSLHRLLALDPHDPNKSPVVILFKFPGGCSCRVAAIRTDYNIKKIYK